MNKENTQNLYIQNAQLVEFPLTKLLKRREIFVLFINFFFFYSCIFERTHLTLAFIMYI